VLLGLGVPDGGSRLLSTIKPASRSVPATGEHVVASETRQDVHLHPDGRGDAPLRDGEGLLEQGEATVSLVQVGMTVRAIGGQCGCGWVSSWLPWWVGGL